MLLSNRRQIAAQNLNNTYTINGNANLQQLQMMPVSYRNKQAQYRQITSQPAPPSKIPVQEEDPAKKKMKWGEPTWYLFHTLSYKIKDEHFGAFKNDLLNKINVICSNLPCPDCANHATKYMNGVNFNAIQTKEQLKKMLFQFHNTVNEKKGFPIFSYEQFDEKYSKAVTRKIVENFMLHFQDKHFSIRMIANDFHRARLVIILKDWFRANIQMFDA
jgi:hypothetical protein